ATNPKRAASTPFNSRRAGPNKAQKSRMESQRGEQKSREKNLIEKSFIDRKVNKIGLEGFCIVLFHTQKMDAPARLIGANHLSKGRDQGSPFGKGDIKAQNATNIQHLVCNDIEPAQAHIHSTGCLFPFFSLKNGFQFFLVLNNTVFDG